MAGYTLGGRFEACSCCVIQLKIGYSHAVDFNDLDSVIFLELIATWCPDSLGVYEIQSLFSFSLVLGLGYQGIWRSRYDYCGCMIERRTLRMANSFAGRFLLSQSQTQLQPNNLCQIFWQHQSWVLPIYATIHHNVHHLLAGKYIFCFSFAKAISTQSKIQDEAISLFEWLKYHRLFHSNEFCWNHRFRLKFQNFEFFNLKTYIT